MRWILPGVNYVYRYMSHKLDAFQAFGEVNGRLPHSIVKPVATYSPWRADREFQEVWSLIHKNTLVDVYRCYELWQLVEESKKLDGDILEVGVWRGGTGCLIARRAKPITVWLCDTFEGVVKAGSKDRHYSGGEHSDTSEQKVRELAAALGVDNIQILVGTFPDQTSDKLTGRRFRMCHIDVDVHDSAAAILEWVWPKLIPGGFVVFDDFGALSTGGITELVERNRSRSDALVIHNLNGHAIMARR